MIHGSKDTENRQQIDKNKKEIIYLSKQIHYHLYNDNVKITTIKLVSTCSK